MSSYIFARLESEEHRGHWSRTNAKIGLQRHSGQYLLGNRVIVGDYAGQIEAPMSVTKS